jgi:hypothetical protein
MLLHWCAVSGIYSHNDPDPTFSSYFFKIRESHSTAMIQSSLRLKRESWGRGRNASTAGMYLWDLYTNGTGQ